MLYHKKLSGWDTGTNCTLSTAFMYSYQCNISVFSCQQGIGQWFMLSSLSSPVGVSSAMYFPIKLTGGSAIDGRPLLFCFSCLSWECVADLFNFMIGIGYELGSRRDKSLWYTNHAFTTHMSIKYVIILIFLYFLSLHLKIDSVQLHKHVREVLPPPPPLFHCIRLWLLATGQESFLFGLWTIFALYTVALKLFM